MKKFLKGAILVIGLLFFVACGGSDKPKALPSEYIGTYINKSDNYIDNLKISSLNNNLIISYSSISKESKRVMEETTISIQNALFSMKKENGETILSLNENTIQDMKIHQRKWQRKDIYSEKNINSYQEFIQEYGKDEIFMEFYKNDTRDDIMLNLETNQIGGTILLFMNGIKQ